MKIAVLTPSADGKVDGMYALSLAGTCHDAPDHNIEVLSFMTLCDSNLGHARDVLLGMALDADVDGIVWIDADQYWFVDDFFELVESGIDLDFVAAVTPMKGDPDRIPGEPVVDGDPDDRLVEMKFVGLGFTYMSRSCAESLWAAGREYTHRGVVEHKVFGFEINPDGRMVGEDVHACETWRKMGHSVWLDTSIRAEHVSYREVLKATRT